jgi:glycosyltransferase involved in cell wall biosynthesis
MDIQVLMKACDVVAVPYRRSLNSGVLALALTWGRPVLLPDNAGSVPLVAGGTDGSAAAGLIYPGDEPEALVEAVRACLTWDLSAANAAAVEAGRRIDRATVATRFATDLRHWADTGSIPTSPLVLGGSRA